MRSLWGAISAVLFCAACATAADAAKRSALDKTTLEAYVRHLFLWGPEIRVSISEPAPSELAGFLEVKVRGSTGKASREELFHVSEGGQQIVQATVYDVNRSPFHKDLSRLTTDSQPSIGTPGAPVVLVLFTDFQCGYCRAEAKMLRENLLAAYPEQVCLYVKDFPLEQIHPWSKMAAIAGRCVFRQSPAAFWDYHDWIFEHQGDITPENLKAKFLEFTNDKSEEIDVLRLAQCFDARATEAEVNESIAEARELAVNATPTLFVNGRRISSQIAWPRLQQIIDMEIQYQRTAMPAGDDSCCAVELPIPLNHY